MDNKNSNPTPENDSWMDELLPAGEVGDEIGPDEQAIRDANLSHPSDAEVDRIVRETKEASWDMPPASAEAQMFHDDEYRDAFGDDDSLSQVFSDKPMKKADAQPPEEPPVPGRKSRPARKKGAGLLGIPHILATVVWIAIIFFIGSTLGRMIWVCAADVLAFGREDEKVTITVTAEDAADMEALSQKLADAGLVKYPGLFKLYADIAVDEGEIDPGTYELNTLYDYMALKKHMKDTSSAREVVEIMFHEGSTCADIFKLLEEKNVCTVEQLEEAAVHGDLGEYWFLEGVDRDHKYCLEGFLFPDTYEFYTNDKPERVLKKFLVNFNNRFTSNNLESKLAALNAQLGPNHAMTVYDIIILASMVEKETSGVLEGYTISSVIYNRLTRWDVPFLNIDATLIYALGGNVDPETGKVKPLSKTDLEMDHPYNTYKYIGLPPGPISNPGLSSLDAALEPEDTDYFYYALDPEEGNHRFFTNSSSFYDFLDTVEYG